MPVALKLMLVLTDPYQRLQPDQTFNTNMMALEWPSKSFSIKMGAILPVVVTLLGIILAWTVWILCLHPLAKIPGSRLAALSPILQFYHEVYHADNYYDKIRCWHKVYGRCYLCFELMV